MDFVNYFDWTQKMVTAGDYPDVYHLQFQQETLTLAE